tara:strand:- start:678 stop:932 length:255 start_codon:yes stop_codon:yes gene_type:complete
MASKQQTKLIKKWKDKGYTVVNLIRTNCNGISDLIAFKDGHTVFIESKEKNDTLSTLQYFRLKSFVVNGFDVYVNETPFNEYVK